MIIDIIIPYFRTDLYPKCVQRIQECTAQGTYQIFLVDDSQGIMGPIKAYNMGLRKTARDVVLMNDDILVTEAWLSNMIAVHTDVVLSLYANEPFYPNISCTFVKRAVIHAVGELDEKWFLGFGADNQWFARIQQAGFSIGVNQRNRIFHEHRASIRKIPNYMKIAQKEQKMFLDMMGMGKTL